MDLAEFLVFDNGAPAEAPALFDESSAERLSYGEWRRRVSQLARLLADRSRGLMLLGLDNAAADLSAYLGALAARHAVAVIDPALAPPALASLIERYAPDWCFLPASRASEAAATSLYDAVPGPCCDGRLWRRREPLATAAALHPDLSVLLPTSGSTGSPKLVRLSAANVISNTADIVETLAIDAADRAITSLPVHYSYGLSVVHSHLRAGASIVLTRRGIADPGFWGLVAAEGCTSFAGVPFSYRTLRRLDFSRMGDLPLVKMTQAGGKLDEAEIRHFYEVMDARGGRFYVMYGQTEASPRMTVLPHRDMPGRYGSVGRPMPSGRLWIAPIDEAGEETAAARANGLGEVYYAGPNVMMGYAEGRADLARGDETGGVLATGDLGYIDADGFLFIGGRRKRIAKVLGRRVSLEDVEAAAAPWGECAAIEGREQIHVFVVSPAPAEQVKAGILRSIDLLPGCIKVIPLDALPRRSNGKTDYQALRSRV